MGEYININVMYEQHWRTHAGPDDLQGQRFDKETYEHWLELVKKEEDAGLIVIPPSPHYLIYFSC